MYESTNPLSTLSYTNKDFQTIYPELLETVKKLTYKWDPTISNESDPGVILLKLNAIIADKNNYNIDKNILENYPETYTQEVSARSQYKQLGYKMPWYRAAKTTVNFKWSKEDRELQDGEYVTIPRYTMLSDSDNDKIYTTISDLTIGLVNNGNGTGSVEAMQGSITTLTIAGNQNITLNNLDSQNRLYINDYNIAQNGIFITNTSDIHNNLWKQVDNVEVQTSGTPCYEFDIDPRNNICYLQFPEDIADLIGSGLTIKYLITRGFEGNVGARTINKIYQEVESNILMLGEVVEPVTLNNESLLLYNSNATSDGKDPETIEEAYKSYKHVVGTFNTLVTLRDYMNAIYNSDYVSNVIVTDRTNDIQDSYKIIDRDPTAVTTHTTYMEEDNSAITFVKYDDSKHRGRSLYVRSGQTIKPHSGQESSTDLWVKSDDNKYMKAFDLKFYLLKRSNSVSSISDYEQTFDIDDSNATKGILETYLNDCKSLQHDFKDVRNDVPFMLQNVYPIRLKIVPTYKLNAVDINSVATNIQNTLKNLLQSRNVEFGEEPQYDVIYDAIVNSDERIKVVIMDDFDYTTYALYYDSIHRITYDDRYNEVIEPAIDGKELKKVPINNFDAYNIISIDTLGTHKQVIDALEARAQLLIGSKQDPSDYIFLHQPSLTMYLYDDKLPYNKIYKYSDVIYSFRNTIVTKNVLAGVTPLYENSTKFNSGIQMQQVPELSVSADKISTSLTVAPFGFGTTYDENKRDAEYKLEANENLRFLAPSFITDKNYSNYVKFELVMKAPTGELEYAYADPDDVQSLLLQYGNTNFYRSLGNNRYEKIKTRDYTSLTSQTPRFKLDTYFKGESYSDMTLSKMEAYTSYDNDVYEEYTVNNDTTLTGTYVPQFEPNMYYEFDENSGEHRLLNSPPSDWNIKFANYCRLRQFVPEYVPVVSSISDGESIIDSDAIAYPFGSDAVNMTHVVSKYNNSIDYYYYDGSSYKKVEKKYSDDESWVNDAYSNNYCTLQNLVLIDPTNIRCYTRLRGEFSDIYVMDEYGYFNMITSADGNLTPGTYYKAKEPSGWKDMCGDTDTVSTYVRFVKDGMLGFDSASGVIPMFEHGKYYALSTPKDSAYSSYTLLTSMPSNWGTSYKNYYEAGVEKEELGFDSIEYTQWLNGFLTLYIPKGTYNVTANTDYQLREGDYLTFFWRESDDDDAPYNYVCYNHIYDEDNDLPTIIRPNFNLTASSYDNCKVDPKKLLSSGVVKYDSAANSTFQTIYLKLYGTYDLSGTKQIDLRKINSKKLKRGNHIYFITNNVKTNNNTQKDNFELNLKRYSYDAASNKAVYTYTLQNDEYFVYTDERKESFEVLSAGTLIKLTRVSSELPTLLTVQVECVNISDVMYYGIDTFKDQCIQINYNDNIKDNWLLIEQQIYSFTEGDTVILHMGDNFSHKYEQCNENNVVPGTTFYERSTPHVPVAPVYVDVNGVWLPQAPTFITETYYDQYGNLLLSQPDDWESSYGKYFRLGIMTYVECDPQPTEQQVRSDYSKYYIYVTPEYPVYTTNNESYVRDYSVSYKVGDGVAQQLPPINVLNDEYQWCVTANLNIKFDNKDPQEILPHSYIDDNDKLVVRKSHQVLSIGGKCYPDDFDTNEQRSLYLLGDVLVDKIGGTNVDISYITAAGDDPNSVEIFAYHLNEGLDSNNWGYTADGKLKLTVKPSKSVKQEFNIGEIKLDFNHDSVNGSYDFAQTEEFKYILPVYTFDSTIEFELSYVYGQKFKRILESLGSEPNRNGMGVHYYKINKDVCLDDVSVVVYNTNQLKSNAEIIFDNLFKCRDRVISDGTDLSRLTSADVEEFVSDMDIPNTFKYNHIVDESIKIDDPLKPASIFDSNHVYNKFSIAKAELRFNKSNGASVTFVNNR